MASYIDIKTLLQTQKTILTTLDLKKLLNIESARTLEDFITRLIDEKILINLEKGKYYLADKKPESFEIAQYLYNPSYVSFETALNYYGLLEQFPFEITSATTKKKKEKIVEGVTYTYSKINLQMFTGYVKEQNYLIATKEKALFDELYLIYKGIKSESILKQLDYTKIDRDKLNDYFKLLPNLAKLL